MILARRFCGRGNVCLVNLDSHVSWHVQYLVILACHFPWQARYLVTLDRPLTFLPSTLESAHETRNTKENITKQAVAVSLQSGMSLEQVKDWT